jgi:cell division protein FtsL
MQYQSQVAPRLTPSPSRQEERALERRRALRPITGGGQDARERAGIGATTLARFRVIMAVVAFVFVVAAARVALVSATTMELIENAQIKTEVSAAQDLGKELSIESSVLSNINRISRIATTNYGMVYAGAGETLVVGTQAAGDAAQE